MDNSLLAVRDINHKYTVVGGAPVAIYVIVAIVAVVITLLIAVPVTANISVKKKTEKDAETIGTAEVKARSIIDEALKSAETKKREALLEAKEENLRTKNELEKETKERRAELQKYEKRVLSREEAVDKKADALEKREADYTACLLYTSPSPRDRSLSRMPSSA